MVESRTPSCPSRDMWNCSDAHSPSPGPFPPERPRRRRRWFGELLQASARTRATRTLNRRSPRMVKRRNTQDAPHDRTAATRVLTDCTPRALTQPPGTPMPRAACTTRPWARAASSCRAKISSNSTPCRFAEYRSVSAFAAMALHLTCGGLAIVLLVWFRLRRLRAKKQFSSGVIEGLNSQSHTEKSVRLSDVPHRRTLSVSRARQASRAKTSPQILLTNRKGSSGLFVGDLRPS